MWVESISLMSEATNRNPFLPVDSHFIEVNGFRMHYLDEGSGPPLIALHGNPTWCFYYRHLVQALKNHFRVIVPDQIGCGLSERNTHQRLRARDRAEQLEVFLELLGIERFSLVMHDWGGPIGTFMALKNLKKVEKLVYLNTTMTEIQSLPRFIRAAANPWLGKIFTQYTRHFLRWTCRMGANIPLNQQTVQGYMDPYQSVKDRSAIWGFVDDIPFNTTHPTHTDMLTLEKDLPKLKDTPIQVIWGMKDLCFHPKMLRRLLRHFPHAELLEIPDASHLVLEDAPDLACQTISEFLRKRDPFNPSARISAVTPTLSASQNNKSVLYRAFSEMVNQQPDHDAVIFPHFKGESVSYDRITFHMLNTRINRYRRGLHNLGLSAGDRVLTMVPPGADFLALAYAVMAEGAVPVFIDPGIDRKHFLECIEDIKPDVFIGSPRAHLIRLMRSKAFENMKFHLIVSTWSLIPGPTISHFNGTDRTWPSKEGASDIALILFTSGATGKPKGVIYTQDNILAQLSIFRDVFGIKPGCRDLPLLPFFSIYNLALGVGSALPPINPSKPLSLDPAQIVRMITDLRIARSFGSPTLWKKISQYCLQTNLSLTSLKSVFMAGAPVPGDVLSLVQSVLSKGQAYTPFGATEALPVTLGPFEEIHGTGPQPANTGDLGTYVGKPVHGVSVRIIKPSHGAIPQLKDAVALPPFAIGEVAVRGPNVSGAYDHRPDADRVGKIRDNESVWHRMGDMGYVDNEGGLYFCGRKAHIVQADRQYFSIPVERIFNEHPKVCRSALISLSQSKPGIVIEPEARFWPKSSGQKRLFAKELRDLASKHELAASIEKVYFYKSFPVDNRHNAKIYRDRLSEWAKRKGIGY